MKYYRCKYRLRMQHSFDNLIEHKHHHVIELEIVVHPQSDKFIEFSEIEQIMNSIIDPYQDKYLNDLEEFGGNTTIENIGEVCYSKLKQAFAKTGWDIARFEVSETPLRVYAIVSEGY